MADNSDKAKEFFSEFRVSRGLSPARLTALSVALGFCIGFVALCPQVAAATPARTMLSYLFAGLIAGFTVWTVLDMQNAAPAPHGLYRLALQSHTDWLSSTEGWLLLGGELTLVALLARTFSDHALSLVQMPPKWAAPATAAGIVLLMSVPALLGKGRRRLQTSLLILPLAAIWICIIVGRVTGVPFATLTESVQSRAGIWASTALALAGFWALEAALVESEDLQRLHASLPQMLVVVAVLIPISGGLAALAAPVSATALIPWAFWERWGAAIGTVAKSLLLAGAVWWLLSIFDRRGIAMARHGFLPRVFANVNARLRTPLAFHVIRMAAAMALALLVPRNALAAGASFAWGMAAIGVNVAAIIRYYTAEESKRKTSLPFFPLIPGMGIAGALFLMTFLPGQAWLAGALWLGAALGIYALFGIRWRSQTREGITIFREEEARPHSDFRILVPVANPKTTKHLMELAVSLAKPRGGDIVALQVVETPGRVSIASGRRLARGKLEALKMGVPVHAMTRVARHVQDGILDTAEEDDCNLIILGWTQQARATSGSLGRVLDGVLRDAPCNVLIFNGQIPQHIQKILVPITRGPHAEATVQMAGLLAKSTGARVSTLHVLPAAASAKEETEAHERMTGLLEPLEDSCPSEHKIIRSDDVVQAIVQEAEGADFIVMSTARESWLDRVQFGLVPEQVAARTDAPLILVKSHSGLARKWLQRFWDAIYGLFPNLESEETTDLYRDLREGARGDVNYYVLIVLSAIIASLGLLANSAAVIIGAMLVAPLMTPILALSLGIVLGEPRMLRRGIESTIKGVGAAVALSAFAALLFSTPQATAEIMARTRPTLLDLAVALASGAAGAYALARKEVAAALPGVAVAAALMPPVCVVGIGLAQGSGSIMGGALLLFLTNLIAIALAGALIFLLLGIRPAPRAEERQAWLRRGLTLSATLLVVISILLAAIMVQTGRSAGQQRLINGAIGTQIQQMGAARLVSVDRAERMDGVWQIEATIQSSEQPTREQMEAASRALADALNQPVQLKLRVILAQETEPFFSVGGTKP
jgi:uncharacterized hydrophobic protein (TIGR00271 family)